MKIAKHITSTQREFKQRKRKQVRTVIAAINNLRRGCAYTPAYSLIVDAEELLMRISDSLSVKNWGR